MRVHYSCVSALMMSVLLMATGVAHADAPATRPAAPHWALHSDVEVKWGGMYRKANIVNTRGEWYLITYDKGPFREWVEPWRIRKIGSTDDPIGHARPNPNVRGAEGPPTEKPGPAPEPIGHKTGDAAALATDQTPITPSDRKTSVTVKTGVSGPMKGPFDAEPAAAKPDAINPIPLVGTTGDFFDQIGAVHVAHGVSIAAVVHVMRSPAKTEPMRVERIDLTAGKSIGVSKIGVSDQELDLSADGKLFLSRSAAFGFGASGRLDVWDIATGPDAKQIISFVPFDNLQPVERDIEWARFVDSEHVVVMNKRGLISEWEIRNARELWSVQGQSASLPALSPTGKYLAFVDKGGTNVAIIETATAKAVASMPTDAWGGIRLSFKPDGLQLAVAGIEVLQVWDLAAGKMIYDLSPVNISAQQIAWPAEGYVLINGSALVPLDKKIVGWTYTTPIGAPSIPGAMHGGEFWCAIGGGSNGKPTLVPIMIPDAHVKQETATIDPQRDLLVYPGSKVSLDVVLPPDVQEKTIAAIKAQLAAKGITVADNAPVKLIARSEAGKTVDVVYNMIGAGGGGQQKLSVATINMSMKYETADGKILWQHVSMGSPPSFISLKQGQTVEQAVQEAMRGLYRFFENTRLPQNVGKSPKGVGSSKVTTAGVEPAAAGA